MLGAFVGLLIISHICPSLPSSLSLCFCLASIDWTASLRGQCHVQHYQWTFPFSIHREHPRCSWNEAENSGACPDRRATDKCVRGAPKANLFSPLSSCSFYEGTCHVLPHFHELGLLQQTTSSLGQRTFSFLTVWRTRP